MLQYAAVAALCRRKQNQHMAGDENFSYVRWDACVTHDFCESEIISFYCESLH